MADNIIIEGTFDLTSNNQNDRSYTPEGMTILDKIGSGSIGESNHSDSNFRTLDNNQKENE